MTNRGYSEPSPCLPRNRRASRPPRNATSLSAQLAPVAGAAGSGRELVCIPASRPSFVRPQRPPALPSTCVTIVFQGKATVPAGEGTGTCVPASALPERSPARHAKPVTRGTRGCREPMPMSLSQDCRPRPHAGTLSARRLRVAPCWPTAFSAPQRRPFPLVSSLRSIYLWILIEVTEFLRESRADTLT